MADVLGGPTDSFFSKGEAVYRYLRRGILNGEFVPDETVHQQNLASSLGFSITPLREAIRRLQAEGLVQVGANGAVRIAPLRLQELRDLYIVRANLDPLTARLAASQASEHQIEQLSSHASGTANLPVDRRRHAHTGFHRALYAASNNGVLEETCVSLWERTDRYRILLDTYANAEEVQREHQQIAEAVANGDEERAAQLVEAHTESARRLIEAAARDREDFAGDSAVETGHVTS